MAKRGNPGAKSPFPREVLGGTLDIGILLGEVVAALGLSQEAETPAERDGWRVYAALQLEAARVRNELLDRSARSHDTAIAGVATELCRVYEGVDDGCPTLHCAARARLGGGAQRLDLRRLVATLSRLAKVEPAAVGGVRRTA